MNQKMTIPATCFFLIFGSALCSLELNRANATSSVGGKTLVLYDAGSDSTPAAPLMNFTDFPPNTALPAYINGLTVLDTITSGNDTYAGWISNDTTTAGFPILDRAAGFQLEFSLQIVSETHANNNRAGFSIIILSEDSRGIELAFWENEIWAQNDYKTGGWFTHGEGIIFATTAGLMNYQVIVVNDTYRLTANNETILTGPLRDYRNFEGFPDPYETPNLLFLGDDTTSAQARVQMSFVSVTGTERTTPTSSPLPSTSRAPSSIMPSPSPIPTLKVFGFYPFIHCLL